MPLAVTRIASARGGRAGCAALRGRAGGGLDRGERGGHLGERRAEPRRRRVPGGGEDVVDGRAQVGDAVVGRAERRAS